MTSATIPKRRTSLKSDFATYHKLEKELLRDHEGKFALIHGKNLVGVYPTSDEALSTAAKDFGYDIFLIMHIARRIDADSIYFGTESVPRAH